MDKRRKVAVFTSNIYEPMTCAIQEGINQAAIETGVKVIYFTSFSDAFSNRVYDQYIHYDEGDATAFEIPDLDDFDGIVRFDLAYGVFAKKHLDDRLAQAKVPIINVSGFDPRYVNIVNDEAESFRMIISHLIEKHGCKDIYHVAGIKEKTFTLTRLQAYRSTLEEFGIPFEASKVYYGTLWRDCGEPALEYILKDCEKRGKKYPDAIVCANDYSAIGVVNACRAHGISVPGDIIVTGFDGVDEAFQGYPSITTGAQPFCGSGYESIYALQKYWETGDLPKEVHVHSVLKCNQSCGCLPMTTEGVDDVREQFTARLDRVVYLAQATTNLILSVSNAATIEECFDEISKNASIDTGFEDMLLCLAPNWDKKRILGPDFPKQDEEMTVAAGFIGDIPAKKETFRKKDILPPFMLEDPKPYYIICIHHLQYYMGYLIIYPKNEAHEQLAMKSWIVNLGSMLENWRVRQELNLTVKRMENLYNRDMLTDLYNRHGYELFFSEFFKECRKDGVPLALLVIDMDDLKYVNDTFGHAEGDYSLCTIAEAMNVAARNGEVCLRTGGDEFVVLAKNYSDEKVASYISILRNHIALRASRDKKDYTIGVSIGACVMVPPQCDEGEIHRYSEEYIKIADAAMYEEKKAHKQKKGQHE